MTLGVADGYGKANPASIPGNTLTSVNGTITASFSFSLLQVLTIFYLLISLISLFLFVKKLLIIYRLLDANKKQYVNGVYYVNHNNDLPAFSFFKYAAINMQQYSKDEYLQVIAHENAHIKQWHTVDVLLAEAACVLLWINPLVYKLRSSVKLNLEYIADESVLQAGIDKKNYQINILNSCLNTAGYPLANLFTSSKIKLRIKMMNQKQSPLRNLLKYAFIIPVALAAYLVTSPVIAQNKSAAIAKEGRSAKTFNNIYIVITANTDKELLNTIKSKMEELGLQFDATGEKFVDDHLAAINVQVSQPGTYTGSVTGIAGDKELVKPVIFCYEKGNGFHLTNGEIPGEISGFGRKIVTNNLNGIVIVSNGGRELHGSCHWD
ncbi:MAG TPA: M56 family metallopeptidase [Chitinophagaceae bacterium]|nr:M56 family metallopeptidase [Chitinophagaceae bacterium]